MAENLIVTDNGRYLTCHISATSYANRSDQKTRATLSTNQEQKLNHLVPHVFPRFREFDWFYFEFLSSRHLPSIWFAVVITLFSFYDILLKSVMYCNSCRFIDLTPLIEIRCTKKFVREDCCHGFQFARRLMQSTDWVYFLPSFSFVYIKIYITL